MSESGAEGRGRIVVGIDGSEGSKHALRWAVRQAGLRLEAVIGWQYPAFFGLGPHAHCPVTVIRPSGHGHR